MLDEIDIAFYESGAYYDSSKEIFMEAEIRKLEEEYQFSYVEF